MFKKLVIATVAVAAGLFILNSTHLGSYARTAFHKVKSSVKGQIKPEFMLDTARNEAAQLIPDMRRNISTVAAKEALLESEEKALDAAREQLASMKSVKEQIDTEISRLEAEVQTLRLAQIKSNNNSIQMDDSRLARIRDMLSTVRDQVQVGIKTLAYTEKYDFEAPAPEAKAKNTAQLLQETDEFLGDAGDKTAARK